MSGGMISMTFGMNEIGAAISDEMGAPAAEGSSKAGRQEL